MTPSPSHGIADPSLLGLLRPSTGNTLLHYAVLGPPHVAEVYKAIRAHLLHNPELLQASEEGRGVARRGEG